MSAELDRLYRLTQDLSLDAAVDAYGDRWRLAAARDLPSLERWLANVPVDDSDPDEPCCLFQVYEGVSRLRPLPRSFLQRELERLQRVADRDPGNEAVFWALLAFFRVEPGGELDAVLARIVRCRLFDAHVTWRRWAAREASLLDVASFALRSELKQASRDDADWRVRVMARRALEAQELDHPGSVGDVPPLQVLDRLRVWVYEDLFLRPLELAITA